MTAMFNKLRLFLRLFFAMSVALLTMPAAADGRLGKPEPLIPINTTFNHWDHHWFVWLPKHPTYECIEVMSRETESGKTPAVWVFLTERAGQKRQVHYLNDKALAWPGTIVRDITYQKQGGLGAQSVRVTLADKDNVPIDLAVNVDPSAPMSKAGLTNQSGHSAGGIFMLFFREEAALAASNRVSIGGGDYSFNTQEGLAEKYPFMSAYSRGIFVATLPYGQARVSIKDGVILHNDRLALSRSAENGSIAYQSVPTPDGGFVSLEADEDGGLRSYRRVAGKHEMRIAFEPALRAPESGTNTSTRYSISLDGFNDVVTGSMQTAENAGAWTFRWQHDQPQWAKASALTSTIQPDSDQKGYLLTVAPARAAH